jgi:hypothetical protein
VARLTSVLRPIACLVVLAVAVMAAQGASRRTVFVGVDFTHASFYDEHLLKARAATRSGEDPIHDLLDAKIPSWNRESAIFFGELAGKYGMAGDVDLSTSEELNKGVGAGAVRWSPPPRSSASALTPEVLEAEVKPYAAGLAALRSSLSPREPPPCGYSGDYSRGASAARVLPSTAPGHDVSQPQPSHQLYTRTIAQAERGRKTVP